MSKMNFTGGKEVIERLQKAYGFAKRKDFGDYLEIPSNTFSTWISRSFFPAELIVQCHLETGARLQYLAYGEEPIFDNSSDVKYFHEIRLENGKFFNIGNIPFFINQLPNLDSRESYDNLFVVSEGKRSYFVQAEYGDLIDGDYFVVVENSSLLRYITVLPGGKVRLDGGKFSFEANVADIEIAGKVIFRMEKI